MRRWIWNADDFGLTSGVNRAVLELHQTGALTSATLMANARATDEAVRIALANPTLGVGCHIVLVDGEPILPADQIPSLIDPRTGCFWTSPGIFLRRLMLGRIRVAEIQAEAAAQIDALQRRGLRLTHVDTHKHMHSFPGVLKPVLAAAESCGVRVIRNPFEASWSVRATKKKFWQRRLQIRFVNRYRRHFLRAIAKGNFQTTAGSVGVLATGHWTPSQMDRWIDNMPAGDWELVTHPGYSDQDLESIRTRLRQSRELEREYLMAVSASDEIPRISFAALASNQ